MSLKAFGALFAIAIAAAVGWHWSLRDEAVERVQKMPQIAAVSRAMPIAVYVNPVTNRVEVGLAVAFAADPKGLLSRLAADMGVALAADKWPPLIESELARFARERNDVYALAIPYNVVIVDRGSRKK